MTGSGSWDLFLIPSGRDVNHRLCGMAPPERPTTGTRGSKVPRETVRTVEGTRAWSPGLPVSPSQVLPPSFRACDLVTALNKWTEHPCLSVRRKGANVRHPGLETRGRALLCSPGLRAQGWLSLTLVCPPRLCLFRIPGPGGRPLPAEEREVLSLCYATYQMLCIWDSKDMFTLCCLPRI